MTKSNKKRAGLQKKVSSVFKGVSAPGANRAGAPTHKKAPDRKAVPPNATPDDSLSLYSPEADKAPQAQASAGRTRRQSRTAVESAISTDFEPSQNSSVDKPAPAEEPQSTAALEPEVMYTPASPAASKTVQKSASEKSDPVDKPAGKKTVDHAPRASTSRPTGPSSLTKKLAQLEESQDGAGGSASTSEGPILVKDTAGKIASAKAEESDPPASTDVRPSQSSAVDKPASSEGSQSTVALEPEVMYTPASPAEPKTVQKSTDEQSDPVDKPVDKKTPKKATDAKRRTSTSQPAGPSSLMKKLAQSEESQDDVDGSASTSEGPVLVKSTADQTASEKAKELKPPSSTDSKKAQTPLARTLAQAEEAANHSPAKRANEKPVSKPASRQSTQSPRPRDVRQPQAPNRNPVADQLAAGLNEVGFLEQIKERLIPSGGGAKDKVMVVLVPVLAIAMIFVFRQVLHKSPGKTQAADKKDDTAVAAVEPPDQILWTIPDPLPAMTRDPLKLPKQDEPEDPNQTGTENPDQGTTAGQTQTRFLPVRDIVYSNDKATALIGNQIVRAGSKINGITIIRINPDSVELERNGETWVQKVRD